MKNKEAVKPVTIMCDRHEVELELISSRRISTDPPCIHLRVGKCYLCVEAAKDELRTAALEKMGLAD